MRRGEVRVIHSRVTGRDQHALIISNDALNESAATGWAITAPIDTTGASPDILVTVPIIQPVKGVIRLDSITAVQGPHRRPRRTDQPPHHGRRRHRPARRPRPLTRPGGSGPPG